MDYSAIYQKIPTEIAEDPAVLAILAFLGIMGLALAFLFCLGAYLYFALALRQIAKNNNYKRRWLAWIPVANMFLFPLVTGRKWQWGLLFFVPVVGTVLLMICIWELLEKKGMNGKWSLVMLGGILSKSFSVVVLPAYAIIIGLLAWKKK